MGEDIYGRLADALNALPNGFPRTASGVELRLIKKVYTPEEVELAGQMSRKYESADELADRVGLSEDKVKTLLDAMLPRNLVRQTVVEGVRKYRLGYFILGWYERHMHRMDKEFAELFEQYMAEGGAQRILEPQPGILGVVPVRGSVKPELLQPYEDLDAHFQRYERFAVQDCVCRIQKNFVGSDCPTPVKRCAFVGLPPQVPLSENILDREQALKLFDEIEEMGLVHLGFYGFTAMTPPTPMFAGCCNCCGDCCGVLRGITEFGLSEAPTKSNYRAVIDLEECNGCGNCIEYCQVHAVTEGKDGMPVFERAKCIGCGQCVIKCPTDAVEMVPVSEEEWFHIPASFEEWEERRMRNLGMIP